MPDREQEMNRFPPLSSEFLRRGTPRAVSAQAPAAANAAPTKRSFHGWLPKGAGREVPY